jgi:hypothetical protein
MLKNASDMLRENYRKLGELTDSQFIVAKSEACAKKLIHAENIYELTRIVGGLNESITVGDIKEGDTIRVKATVKSMLGGVEKTGYIILKDVQEVYYDKLLRILTIDADGVILTTMDMKAEVLQLNAVINGDNWVNHYSLSELIGRATLLKDYQLVREEKQRSRNDLIFDDRDEGHVPTTLDLLF